MQFPEERRSILKATLARMRAILEGLREQNASTSGALFDAAKADVPLVPLVQEIVQEKQLQYGHRSDVTLDIQLPAGNPKVKLQPVEFRRILSNLVDNSYQALDKAGKIVIRVADEKGQVQVKVSDDGKGIPAEIRPRLFERGVTHGKAMGSGLGLWYAKESVRAWNADIAVESEPGKGTSVTLSFPGDTAKAKEMGLALFLFGLLSLSSVAGAATLTDTLSSHQILIDSEEIPNLSMQRLGVLIECLPEGASCPLDRSYVERLIRSKFASQGVSVRLLPRTFQNDFLAGKLGVEDLLRPKLAITFQNGSPAGGKDSAIEIELALLTFPRQGDRYVMEKSWLRKHRLAGLTGPAVEESISRLLQRELSRFLKENENSEAVIPKGVRVASLASTDNEDVRSDALKYSLDFRDEESLSPLISIGATAGLPVIANLRIAYWGNIRFPILLGLSGMYLGMENRGIQLDAGYVFDRVGNFKQGLSLVVNRMNETWRRESTIPLERGRTATRVEVDQILRTHLGLAYSAQFGSFTGMIGALKPLGEGPTNSIRALIQVGYAPLFLF